MDNENGPMSREYQREKMDRSAWAPGPWDNEPDFYEWTTRAGYEAYAYRLHSGAWATAIVAPHPLGIELMKFMHTLRDEFENHLLGNIMATDVPTIGEFGISFEHWASPGTDRYRTSWRGPYKILKEVVAVTETSARDISELNKIWNTKKEER
jgi:hypothetical protein